MLLSVGLRIEKSILEVLIVVRFWGYIGISFFIMVLESVCIEKVFLVIYYFFRVCFYSRCVG